MENSPGHDHISTKPARWYERFWIVCGAIFAVSCTLLAGYKFLSSPEASPQDYLALLLKESGFAALVALMLNLSIEWVNRRKHADEESRLISKLDIKHQERQQVLLRQLEAKHEATSRALLKDVFQTVYERYIDTAVFKVIDNHLLKKDVMRRNYKASMTIRSLQPEGKMKYGRDMVSLSFSISFDAVNLTKTTITTTLLPALIDVTPGLTEHCKFISARIGDDYYDAARLGGLAKYHPDDSTLVIKLPGSIPAHGLAPINLVYEKVAPSDYSEVICSTVQMDGMSIDVMCLDPRLSTHAVSLHPEDEEEGTVGGRPEHKEWRIGHAILPGQGAVIFWHPRRIAVDQSDQVAHLVAPVVAAPP